MSMDNFETSGKGTRFVSGEIHLWGLIRFHTYKRKTFSPQCDTKLWFKQRLGLRKNNDEDNMSARSGSHRGNIKCVSVTARDC